MNDILNEPINVDNPSTQSSPEGAKPDVVRIAVLIDESGSMLGAAKDTINNLNSYIDEQATSEKEILISIYTFNDNGVRDRYVSVDAKSALHMELKGSVPITAEYQGLKATSSLYNLIYAPSGGTPLYDAIATVIVKETSTVPTLVVILTDGEENASREYRTLASIQTLIKQQEEAGWSFVFLMAGLSRAQAESYTSSIMGRGYEGATMNYSKGTENIAFHNLATASATWETAARSANMTGVVLDSATMSQNFFAADLREVKVDHPSGIINPSSLDSTSMKKKIPNTKK